jgi:segregation and condensation protein B
MPNIEKQIESILLYKNEPVSLTFLVKKFEVDMETVKTAVSNLQDFYKDRGITIVSDGEEISFGTSPDNSGLIEEIEKQELSRDLGRAGLETLAIVLYKGPISRREIDYIRGVNSTFILRNLLVRGLVERVDKEGERSYSYKPTLKLLEYLGVSRIQDLPEYETAFKKMEEFVKTETADVESE